MGKAKIASEMRQPNVQVKQNHDGYIRFGYRMPHGLVVTRMNAKIGIGETGSDGEPVLLPCGFIDMAPVAIPESINFDHLTEVILFAVAEKAKMDFDEQVLLANAAKVAIIDEERAQAEYDSKWDTLTYEADTKLPNQLPDEECTCDQCENNCTGFDPQYNTEIGAYLPDPGDEHDIPDNDADADTLKNAGMGTDEDYGGTDDRI